MHASYKASIYIMMKCRVGSCRMGMNVKSMQSDFTVNAKWFVLYLPLGEEEGGSREEKGEEKVKRGTGGEKRR